MSSLYFLLFTACQHSPADKTIPNTQDTAVTNPDSNAETEPMGEPSTEPSTEDTNDTDEPEVDPETLIDAEREGWVLVWRDEFLDSEIRRDPPSHAHLQNEIEK